MMQLSQGINLPARFGLRLARLSAIALALAAGSLLDAQNGVRSENGATAADPTPYASPEATFRTFRKAWLTDDHASVCQCYTEDGLNELAGGLRMIAGILSFFSKGDPALAELSRNVKAVVDRHVPKGTPDMNLNLSAPEEEIRSAVRQAGKAIPRREAFCADLLKLLSAHAQQQLKRRPFEKVKLTNVRIEGEKATATLSESLMSPQPTPIVFRRVQGNWKINREGQYSVTSSDDPVARPAPKTEPLASRAPRGVPAPVSPAPPNGFIPRVPQVTPQPAEQAPTVPIPPITAPAPLASPRAPTAAPARRIIEPTELAGTWQIRFPRGATRSVTLMKLGNNQFKMLKTGVLDGVYKWHDGALTVVKPSDDRMVGLKWSWEDGQLLLVDEPAEHPTGSSYVGTTLKR